MILKNRKVCFWVLLLSFFVLLACEHTPERGPEPLEGFFEKVTALVTTTLRSHLRGDLSKQRLLEERIPSFERMTHLNQLTTEMRVIESLKDLGDLIEKDVFFELQKPEHDKERDGFNSPEIQRSLILSITSGMKRALDQLRERKDAN